MYYMILYVYGIYVSSFINIYCTYTVCTYYTYYTYHIRTNMDVYSYGAQHGERPNNAN